ncbi:hypothetical protein AWU67_12675 [Microterricola viridarii]|uniref:Asl1-like glycosyl hydrolase catalytic domain-containing protein n=1 Tax=Microterricola viridarii TaxID=412690 RepID=A0A0X8E4H7_9MICO|nr:hypothetical protein AWU67_12675 [Microterricola viridarii]
MLTPGGPDGVTLRQTVSVAPLTTYSFGVDHFASLESNTAISIAVGGNALTRLEAAQTAAEWEHASWEYTTGTDEYSLELSINAAGDTGSARIDNVSLNVAGGENLIANASFEDYAADAQITNESLIMQSGAASIGIAARVQSAQWNVRDVSGADVESGSIEFQNGLGLLPLGELRQGYYSVEFASVEGNLPVQTLTFMVLDEAALAEPDERFGVGTHLDRDYYAGSELPAEQIGFTSARTDMFWSKTELNQGEYSFDPTLDGRIAAFAARGIELLPISAYANKYYDGGVAVSSPEGIAGYANYSNAIATHYGATAIELFNEYNHEPFNKGACGRTGSCYQQLLAPTADKIHSESPGTKVVGPANARQDDPFLTELYQAGGLQYLDAVSFHPYEEGYNSGPEFLIANLEQANARIREFNDGKPKPIWLTELGWSTSLVTESQQAENLIRAEAIALAANVERFFWYDLVNDGLDPVEAENSFGLLHQRSEVLPAFQPKPAAMAQAMMIRKLTGKAFSERDTLSETSYSFAFGEGAESTRVAWATSPVRVSYETQSPVVMTSYLGAVTELKPKKGKVTVDLGLQPVFLDGDLSKGRVVK